MSKLKLCRGPALALLAGLLVACGPQYGSGPGNADVYNGVIDNTIGAPLAAGVQTVQQGALATAIQPTVITATGTARNPCNGNASCYFRYQGFAAGKPFFFFIAGNVADTTPEPPFIPTCAIPGFTCVYSPSIATHQNDGGGGFSADVFPHSCAPAPFNPVADAFTRDQQFPLVSAMLLNNSSVSGARPPVGVVAVHGVTGVSGETCNDLKYYENVGTPGNPGHFGSVQESAVSSYQVWMIFDPSLPVYASSGGTPISTNTFWFRGLQGGYLNGGTIPTDANGNLVAMDGVILDPAGSSAFEVPTTAGSVLLPAAPGTPGFSPIVRLHDFRLPSGSSVIANGTQTFTGVCPIGQTPPCPATSVDLSKLSANAFNTMFIVASPQ
jgi:hypothetical protein